MKNLKKSLFPEDLSIRALFVWVMVLSLVAGVALFDVSTSKAHAADDGAKIEWFDPSPLEPDFPWVEDYFPSDWKNREHVSPRDERQQALEPDWVEDYFPSDWKNEE